MDNTLFDTKPSPNTLDITDEQKQRVIFFRTQLKKNAPLLYKIHAAKMIKKAAEKREFEVNNNPIEKLPLDI